MLSWCTILGSVGSEGFTDGEPLALSLMAGDGYSALSPTQSRQRVVPKAAARTVTVLPDTKAMSM